MPRLPAIHDANLKALAEDLRFAPRPALLKHIERTEALASVIEPEQTYPPSWLVFRVTGFRPENDEGDPSQGSAILENLSAFAEHLSEAAAISEAELRDAGLSPEQLCERWGISRKSLDRARRKGLVGRRVRGVGPARRLVFMPAAVAAYEERESPAPSAAGRRMTTRMRERMIRRARRYHDEFDCSINQVAQRLGPRFGFSAEAVRTALKRADERAGPDAIFKEQGPPTPREQAFAFRAGRRGVEPGRIARRLGRPRATVWRAANAHRAALLARVDLAGPVVSAFHDPNAADTILSKPAVLDPRSPALTEDLFALLEQARAAPKPAAAAEHDRALAMHLLRFMARERIRSLSAHEATALDEIETVLRRVSRLKEQLIADSLAFFIATLERRLGSEAESLPPRPLAELSTVMLTALAGAVDRYDPTHGGRLAAPAGLALDRAAAAWLARREHEPQVVGRAKRTLTAQTGTSVIGRRFDPWQVWLEPDARVLRVLDRITESDAELLSRRFGFGVFVPHTLDELAAWLGLPRMHAARRERSALAAALSAARSTMHP